MRIAVIGAGWSGLAAATFLQRAGHKIKVIESTSRPGGRIATLEQDGYLVEAGPHGIIPNAAARELIATSGVPMVSAPPRSPRFTVHKGKLLPLPTDLRGIVRSPLLGPMAKLRLLAEPFITPGRSGETIGSFARRRLGKAVSPIVDAFVTGVYAGDPERLVIEHAFSEMHHMDQHGGLLRNLKKPTRPRPVLTTARYGMQQITDALAKRLPITYQEPVTKVQETKSGIEVLTREGGSLQADHTVLAVDPASTSRLLGIQAEKPPLAPVHVVAFGLPAANAPPEGYGALAPEAEGRFVLGALYESALFAGRAPEGQALVRCLVGGRRHPERAALPHHEIAREAWRDLKSLGIVQGDPLHTFHLPTQGIPQPEAGQAAWLDALPRAGRIHVLGIGHRGVGLNALADEAHALATRLT